MEGTPAPPDRMHVFTRMPSSKHETILKILQDASNKIDAGIGPQVTRRNCSFAHLSSAHPAEVLSENVPSTAEETPPAFALEEVFDAENVHVAAEEVIVTMTEDSFDSVTCVEALLDPMQEAARYFEELARVADEERYFEELARAGDKEAFDSSSCEPYQAVPTEALPASQTALTASVREYYQSTSAASAQVLKAYDAVTNVSASTQRAPTPCDSSTCDADCASPAKKRVRL